MESIPAQVKALVARSRTSRKDLAARAGVSEKHLSQLLNGRSGGSYAMWVRIARALGAEITVVVTDGADDIGGGHGE
jgi:transcriptional regulator with XRE-family HTH domain